MSRPVNDPREAPIDLATVRRRLDGSTGRTYWKSLDELAGTPGFQEFLHREFPEQASEWTDPDGRRDFLKLMGASLALAGLTGCTRQPEEKIVPYVRAPEQMVPGRPLFFATAVTDGGYAKGVLVESHLGRPTKVEGNAEHPASLGATDVFGQAAVLGLYDPDRSQTVTYRGEIRSWSSFLAALKATLEVQRAVGGTGLRILTQTVTSPTLAAQLEALLAEFPSAQWHQYDPLGADNARAGAVMAFGEPVEARYRLEAADVVLSLESDFLGSGPANLRLVREYARRRRVIGDPGKVADLSRLYVIEGSPSITGAAADHRLAVRSSEIEGFARAVAAGLGLPATGGANVHGAWVSALVKDLRRAGGRSLVLVGESQPPAVHALAHLINLHLGSLDKTLVYTAPVVARPVDQFSSLKTLTADMMAGKVDLLLMVGGNPVYDAPADLEFEKALDKVAVRVHHSLYADETSAHCHWHVPAAHSLESWSDARAFDGTVTLIQPLIAPLYASAKTAHEMVAAFSRRPDHPGYDTLRDYWKSQLPAGDFESRWRRALHDGLIAGTALPPKAVPPRDDAMPAPAPHPAMSGFEIVFRLDPTVADGRFANNGWLQELPKPLTKVTWENVALMSPRTAEKLMVTTSTLSTGAVTDVVELKYRGRSVKAPAWILPGHPDDVITVPLGYGRQRAGRVGTGVGFNANALRTSDAPWFGPGLEAVRTGEKALIACTQDHWTIDQTAHKAAADRHLIRSGSLEEYRRDPHVFQGEEHDPPRELSLYPEHKYTGHAWGMTIDLGSCVGCNACVVACQAENNIPVVGKDQVGRGREMQWIRVDRYYSGGVDNPDTHHQPVLCMHCENAPCEVVCPVAATTHSDEGLNDMVYNRCVGTRYCSNNCPYKVRRFNFFLYQDWETPSLKMMRNPDVTVRSRGVMEKCTYCVQRINAVRIDASNQGRAIRDGEIQTACQAVCPAEAITFGDVNDPASQVSRLKADTRSYGLLTELNTRPRTTYLAAVRNPNPDIPSSNGEKQGGADGH